MIKNNKILIIGILIIGIIMINQGQPKEMKKMAGEEWIYQENADSYAIGGSWANQPGINVVDGNHGTYGHHGGNGGSVSYVNITYIKPSGINQINSKWFIHTNSFTSQIYVNVTIPSNCWNYDSNNIYLQTASAYSTPFWGSRYYCYDGIWNLLYDNTVTSGDGNHRERIYEEAMWWSTQSICIPMTEVLTNVGSFKLGTLTMEQLLTQIGTYKTNPC